MENNNPWIVYSSHILASSQPIELSKIVTRFGTKSEAEMHRHSLNRLTRSSNYKVCFDNKA
ncbi:hypothetical protein [Nodularia sphaerocarpa]|uniref:hypothetical protein n=1 Tax=Nodularia sphaerocarpa TaxID=137816 RepID=UPI001EFAAD7B|nr:hypothetical protein [Nodularia sphaerocarpa]MDB9374685.1 hypothetical protein [Nodularia sphaerocarpa CS-585]